MQVKNLVEANAKITRISTLKEGDLYKRVIINERDSSDVKIRVGRVTGILDNGETVVVSACEAWDSGYFSSTPTIDSVVFQGGTDVSVFPLSDVELSTMSKKWFDALDNDIKSSENSIKSRKEDIVNLHKLLDGKKN